MLKELVAKRMLKLQHSAVYSETVTALQRKIATLERRNMELEDKADRLETNIMNLFSEVGVNSLLNGSYIQYVMLFVSSSSEKHSFQVHGPLQFKHVLVQNHIFSFFFFVLIILLAKV